jgi:hypothetical protein
VVYARKRSLTPIKRWNADPIAKSTQGYSVYVYGHASDNLNLRMESFAYPFDKSKIMLWLVAPGLGLGPGRGKAHTRSPDVTYNRKGLKIYLRNENNVIWISVPVNS